MIAVAERRLPEVAGLTGRQQTASDCALCGAHLGVHARLLGEATDRHGHVLLLAACATTRTPLAKTPPLRPVPPAPPPHRSRWKPPPGVSLPASARLPRWPLSDPTPPIWATATAHDEPTLRRVLAGLHRLPP